MQPSRNGFTPSAFLAVAEFGGSTLDSIPLVPSGPGAPALFETSLRGPRLAARLGASSSAALVEGEGPVLALVHGEVYAEEADGVARRLLAAWRAGDGLADVARRIHGSWAALLLDGQRGVVVCLTDPINSRRLFVSRAGARVWISTALSFARHPVGDDELDPAGLASALVNGLPLNGRTLYASVRPLRRASIHELDEGGHRSMAYWRYEFDPETRSGRDLREELAERVVSGVRRRIPSRGPAFVSLSGGYDSTAVLGALREAGAGNVSCFSYTKSSWRTEPDVVVARRTAAVAGFPHWTVPGYRLPLPDVLRDNVKAGSGLTRLVVETDAWRAVADRLHASAAGALFVGDECLGWRGGNLRSTGDVLGVLGFRGWGASGALGERLPDTTAATLCAALDADLREMLAGAPAGEDLHDLKDWLYLDQRLPRLLAWREAFAGSAAPVCNPLLDTRVLELVATVPSPERVNKKLFREAVTHRYPELFREPRIGGGWEALAWSRRTVRREARAIEGLIRSGDSPLDEWIPPRVLLELLQHPRTGRAPGRLSRVVGRLRRRLGPRAGPGGSPLARTVDPAVLLLRAVCLRLVLKDRGGA